jgi:hypothetical protein
MDGAGEWRDVDGGMTMAAVKPQKPDVAENVKQGAAASNNVQALKQQVVDLAQLVKEQGERLERLERRNR